MSTKPSPRLFSTSAGQVALVTGGSRGLGLQIAEALGEAGAKIMLISSRKSADLEEAAARPAGRAASMPAGLPPTARQGRGRATPSSPAKRWSVVGQIDILVNNAGATWGAPAEEHPHRRVGQGHGPQHPQPTSCSAQADGQGQHDPAPVWPASSTWPPSPALGGQPLGAMKTIAYNTSKGAAVINFTRALAGRVGAVHGITRQRHLAPGFFPSKMTAGTLKAMGEEQLAAHAPLRRLGDDEDLKA